MLDSIKEGKIFDYDKDEYINDPISMDHIPVERAILINNTIYDYLCLFQYIITLFINKSEFIDPICKQNINYNNLKKIVDMFDKDTPENKQKIVSITNKNINEINEIIADFKNFINKSKSVGSDEFLKKNIILINRKLIVLLLEKLKNIFEEFKKLNNILNNILNKFKRLSIIVNVFKKIGFVSKILNDIFNKIGQIDSKLKKLNIIVKISLLSEKLNNIDKLKQNGLESTKFYLELNKIVEEISLISDELKELKKLKLNNILEEFKQIDFVFEEFNELTEENKKQLNIILNKIIENNIFEKISLISDELNFILKNDYYNYLYINIYDKYSYLTDLTDLTDLNIINLNEISNLIDRKKDILISLKLDILIKILNKPHNIMLKILLLDSDNIKKLFKLNNDRIFNLTINQITKFLLYNNTTQKLILENYFIENLEIKHINKLMLLLPNELEQLLLYNNLLNNNMKKKILNLDIEIIKKLMKYKNEFFNFLNYNKE